MDLDTSNSALVERLAILTFEAFKENSPDWVPTIELARNQVLNAGSGARLGRVVMEKGQAAGWIGLIKRKRIWEIHPIAVAIEHQYRGFGHLLVNDVARIAKSAGALTLYAGTSDEVGTTNLYGVDLYIDPASAIKNIEAIGRNPYKFWESAGFTVVGLMPDAEGIGKPGIELARRL